VLTQADAAAWPDGKNRTADVMAVIRLLDRGAEAAEQAGERARPTVDVMTVYRRNLVGPHKFTSC
jgi:hypothetical protein